MKIGKFSSENDVSIDTIRHYMELGLIIPEKVGGHYDFDKRCKKDLDDIFSLKEMGFTLNEIKSIFLFKRLGKLTLYQEIEIYKQFFTDKYKKVVKDIEVLQNTKLKLENRIKELSSKKYKENFTIGIDIGALDLFKCLKCNGDLILYEGHIIKNQIIEGKLRCKCGNEYTIKEGILFTNNDLDYIENKFNYRDGKFYITEHSIAEYLNETAPEYLDKLYKGLEWYYKKLQFKELKNKVILELGSGAGFLLRYVYNDLPDDSLYIAVERDINKHRFLKKILEGAEGQKRVIFICSDFLEIPIRDKSVDLLLDYSGTSNYSFEHQEFLLKLIDNHIKDDALLLGGYILFKKFSIHSLINDEYKKNFILSNVKEEIKKLKYRVIDERISDVINEGGKYENYFKEDEEVYNYGFYGKR